MQPASRKRPAAKWRRASANPGGFTADERVYVNDRLRMLERCGEGLGVAWRLANRKPALPRIVRSLFERGLVIIEQDRDSRRVRFTEAGKALVRRHLAAYADARILYPQLCRLLLDGGAKESTPARDAP